MLRITTGMLMKTLNLRKNKPRLPMKKSCLLVN